MNLQTIKSVTTYFLINKFKQIKHLLAILEIVYHIENIFQYSFRILNKVITFIKISFKIRILRCRKIITKSRISTYIN